MNKVCPACSFPNDSEATVCKKCRSSLASTGPEFVSSEPAPKSVTSDISNSYVMTPVGGGEKIHQKSTRLGLDFTDELRPGEVPEHVNSGLGAEVRAEPPVVVPKVSEQMGLDDGWAVKRSSSTSIGDAISRVPEISDGSKDAGHAAAKELVPAGFLMRTVAMLLDLVIVAMAAACTSVAGILAFEKGMDLSSTLDQPGVYGVLIPTAVCLILVLVWLYTFALTFLLGRTMGMWMTGLRVVDLEGETLSLGKSAKRASAGLLNILTLGIGYLMILIDERGRSLQDRLTSTLVVRKS